MTIPQFGPAVLTDSGGQMLCGLPLSGPITSFFGARDIAEHAAGHTGVDIAAAVGTPVLSPAPGLVLEATASSGVFGTYVLLRHLGGFVSLYAHLSRLDVERGQSVRRGDALGLVGLTGLTTGPHLHWGLSEGGTPIVAGSHLRDPLALIAAAPLDLDRERLFRGLASGVLGLLQVAGATMNTNSVEDFDTFAPGSPERQILAIQLAANALIARYAP